MSILSVMENWLDGPKAIDTCIAEIGYYKTRQLLMALSEEFDNPDIDEAISMVEKRYSNHYYQDMRPSIPDVDSGTSAFCNRARIDSVFGCINSTPQFIE